MLSMSLVGCSTTKDLNVNVIPTETVVIKPQQPRDITTRPVNWLVLTKPEIDLMMKNNETVELITISTKDYENLNLNLIEIMRYTRQWREYRDWETDRKSTRLNSSHSAKSRMPSSA